VKLGYIYTLSDPRTNQIRYVGQTINSPSKRLAQHLHQEARTVGKLTYVNSWIRNLKLHNFKPILNVLEQCALENLDEREIHYIREYRKTCNLCNHALGGQGNRGHKLSKESIDKRNLTLKTSELWAKKCKEHSLLMKSLHSTKTISFGYGHISKEKRVEIGRKHSEKMKELNKNNPNLLKSRVNAVIIPVCLLDFNRSVIKVYKSASAAAKDCKIKDATHITRVCKRKAKQTHGLIFAYLRDVLL